MIAKWRTLFVVILVGALFAAPGRGGFANPPLQTINRAAAQGPDTGPYTLAMTLGRGMVRSVAWSPNGDVIAVGGALGIWLYTPDLEDIGLLKGHTKAVYGLAFSPDGKRLASASHDQTARIWDLEAQAELFKLEGHTGLTVAVAWSPDGSMVASGAYDHTVRLWNADTGELVRVLEGHDGWVNQVAFSLDGSQVISSSYDGTIRVWDTNTGNLVDSRPGSAAQWSQFAGQPETAFIGPHSITQMTAQSPDGTKQAVVYWSSIVVVDDLAVPSGRLMRPEHADWITCVEWSPDGSEIVDGGPYSLDTPSGWYRSWNVQTGAVHLSASLSCAERSGFPAASPDDAQTLTLDAGGIARILDTASGRVIAELPGRANAAAWSPDGTQIAVAMRNGTVQIWKAE